jgi:hypothetical protein
MVVILKLVSKKSGMGAFTASRSLLVLGWIATGDGRSGRSDDYSRLVPQKMLTENRPGRDMLNKVAGLPGKRRATTSNRFFVAPKNAAETHRCTGVLIGIKRPKSREREARPSRIFARMPARWVVSLVSAGSSWRPPQINGEDNRDVRENRGVPRSSYHR